MQTRVTFELYYRAQGEAMDSSSFYGVDDGITDEDRRLLMPTAETDSSLSTTRRDDAKRYGTAAAAGRYSTSSTRP